MRAVDTNILVRWITRDDGIQSSVADRVMAEPVFVPLTVLAELAWTLGGGRYRFDRVAIAAALRLLLHTRTVTIQREDGVAWAIDRFAAGADIADMLHLLAARGNDAFVSFEARLAKLAGPGHAGRHRAAHLMAKLYFYYASMNAGKSTNLLQADFNYRERGMRTMLFTAAVDDRFAEGTIASRIGLSAPATAFDPASDLGALVLAEHARGSLACVLVDEAQFLSADQVDQLAALADGHGIPVLCYGLRTDFRGDLFPGSARLLALADALIEIKSVCECGRKAIMNLRVDGEGRAIAEGRQTEIGGNERYVALCRRHFRAALG